MMTQVIFRSKKIFPLNSAGPDATKKFFEALNKHEAFEELLKSDEVDLYHKDYDGDMIAFYLKDHWKEKDEKEYHQKLFDYFHALKDYKMSDFTKAYALGVILFNKNGKRSLEKIKNILSDNKKLSSTPYQDVILDYMNAHKADIEVLKKLEVLYQLGFSMDVSHCSKVSCPFLKTYIKCRKFLSTTNEKDKAREEVMIKKIMASIEEVLQKHAEKGNDLNADVLKGIFYSEYQADVLSCADLAKPPYSKLVNEIINSSTQTLPDESVKFHMPGKK